MAFYKEQTVRIRKPHRCEWCGEVSRIGDSMLAVTGCSDGDSVGTWHWHPECHAAWKEESHFNEYDHGYPRWSHKRGKYCENECQVA